MISMCEAVEDQFLWHWQFFNFRFCNFDDQEGKARAHLWETITVTPFWVFSVTMFSFKSTGAANFPPVTWQVCHARLDFHSTGKVTCYIISRKIFRDYIYPRQCWVSKVDSLKRDEVRSGVFGLSILLTSRLCKFFISGEASGQRNLNQQCHREYLPRGAYIRKILGFVVKWGKD